MQKLFKRGDELAKDMKILINKKRKEDPEYKKAYDDLEDFFEK
jgi:virulence-associated protein VapD